MGFMLAPIQSRVTIPLFCPASPFEGRSSFSLARSLVLNRSLRWCSASPLTPSPPLPRTLSPFAAPSSIYREEVSHTTDSRQFSHLESQNFSLPRLPSSLFPSVPTSLSPFISGLPLSSLASFGVSRTPPPIYTCIPVHFVSTRFVAHASPLLLLLHLFVLALPSAPSGSARARSRGPFPSRLSISSSQAAGTLVLFVLFAPFRFTTGAGRLYPPSPRSSPPPPLSPFSPRLFALLYRAAPPYLLFLTYPCSRRDSVGLHPRSLAARSPTVSSSVRCTFLSISPTGGTGGEGGSLLQVVPASDRRRCRVSRNRSPPMPRGGRTVAPVHLLSLLRLLLLFSGRSILFISFFFFHRGIVNALIRSD